MPDLNPLVLFASANVERGGFMYANPRKEDIEIVEWTFDQQGMGVDFGRYSVNVLIEWPWLMFTTSIYILLFFLF